MGVSQKVAVRRSRDNVQENGIYNRVTKGLGVRVYWGYIGVICRDNGKQHGNSHSRRGNIFELYKGNGKEDGN